MRFTVKFTSPLAGLARAPPLDCHITLQLHFPDLLSFSDSDIATETMSYAPDDRHAPDGPGAASLVARTRPRISYGHHTFDLRRC